MPVDEGEHSENSRPILLQDFQVYLDKNALIVPTIVIINSTANVDIVMDYTIITYINCKNKI